MNALSSIMTRNVVCGLLFLAMLALQLSDVVSDRSKTYGTIALLAVFALVIPIRASFRYVLAKLGINHGDSGDGA
jgi:hypothetical protein